MHWQPADGDAGWHGKTSLQVLRRTWGVERLGNLADVLGVTVTFRASGIPSGSGGGRVANVFLARTGGRLAMGASCNILVLLAIRLNL